MPKRSAVVRRDLLNLQLPSWGEMQQQKREAEKVARKERRKEERKYFRAFVQSGVDAGIPVRQILWIHKHFALRNHKHEGRIR